MPTGYTAKLSDGEQSFEEFVWSCARAFGALVLMRDAPSDARIPERFEPSEYYTKSVRECESRRAEWLSSNEVSRRAMYEAQKLANAKVAEDSRAKAEATQARYEGMLKRARAWNPPSGEHMGLRDFMIEQLQSSISFDCHAWAPKPLPEFATWCEDETARLERDLLRARASLAEEELRTENRNRWLSQLRASVPQPEVAP